MSNLCVGVLGELQGRTSDCFGYVLVEGLYFGFKLGF